MPLSSASTGSAVAALAARARRGKGPALLECRTYRLSGHSRGDRREYRTREEEQAAWRQEPIARLAERLRGEGLLDAAGQAAHEAAAADRVAAAIAFAEASPEPDPAAAGEGVFA